MATPMCAAFSAGASLTPSPVIATTSPLALEAPAPGAASARAATRQKTLRVGQARRSCGVVQRPRVSAPVSTRRSPRARPDARWPRGGRIVAGDHDHADARRTAFGDGGRHLGPHRIFEPSSPRNSKSKSCWSAGQALRVETPRARHASTRRPRRPAPRPRANGAARCARRGGTDRRWPRAHPWRRPRRWRRSGDCQTRDMASSVARQRIVLAPAPVGVQVLGAGQHALPGLARWPLHRVEGAAVAGQHRELEQRVQFLRQRPGAGQRASR